MGKNFVRKKFLLGKNFIGGRGNFVRKKILLAKNFIGKKFFKKKKILGFCFRLNLVSDRILSWTKFCLILFKTEFCLGLHTTVVFHMQSFNCSIVKVDPTHANGYCLHEHNCNPLLLHYYKSKTKSKNQNPRQIQDKVQKPKSKTKSKNQNPR